MFSEEKDDAYTIVENSLKIMNEIIIEQKYISIEPYWKIEKMYVVEIDLIIRDNYKYMILFLNSISDCWIRFGDPTDELLASQSGGKCYIKNDKIRLINIFFMEYERNCMEELAGSVKLVGSKD